MCTSCSRAEKAKDTVTLDMAEMEKQRKADEARQRAEEARLAEEKRLAEVKRVAEEREKRERAEAQQRQEEERRRQEEEEVQRKKQEEEKRRADAEERRKREEVAKAEAAARQKQDEVDKNKLEEWLAAKKFHDPNTKKTSWFKSSLPLHTAVTDGDPEMVRILIASKADVNVEDSKKQTPLALAEKLAQKNGAKYDSLVVALT
uniref:Uncharacterized protein n=1 Tax=Noctiluca scintillans TaxID=2966 RepID=A0A7S1ATD3_NOCSC